jgi:Domain of unknown function (DUF4189)
MIRSMFFVLLWFACNSEVLAEANCPDGYFPIGDQAVQGCAPIPTQGGGGMPPDPGPFWAKRYGAMVIDLMAGKYAGVDGYSSLRRAERAALSRCKSSGGKKCKVFGTYSNQWGALAWGDSFTQAYRAPTLEEATGAAVRLCSEKTTNCGVFFSGCSYPERVR